MSTFDNQGQDSKQFAHFMKCLNQTLSKVEAKHAKIGESARLVGNYTN